MIRDKRVLAVIPARGGSKGIPQKNLRLLGDKPLIAWTIETAKQSTYIDRLIVSSDDPQIIQTAHQWDCEAPFVRPAELAQDSTPGMDPVLHALEQLPGYDYVVLLQPTSPLRSTGDIDACIDLCAAGAPACVSVTLPGKSPYWMYTLSGAGEMQPLLPGDHTAVRRQDLPAAYALNGAVYVAEVPWLQRQRGFIAKGTKAYVMPAERSIDIDAPLDLAIAELYIKTVRCQ